MNRETHLNRDVRYRVLLVSLHQVLLLLDYGVLAELLDLGLALAVLLHVGLDRRTDSELGGALLDRQTG